MKTASSLFNAEDIRSVEVAIAEAEKMTAGEIVPVVATVSGRYDRAEDLFGLVFALIALTTIWMLFQSTTETDWAVTQSAVLGLPAIVGILIGGFVIGAVLATHFPVLRLPFIARAEMLEEVERRALETFQRERVRDTSSSTGVLIYVSLYEHLVKVSRPAGPRKAYDKPSRRPASYLPHICRRRPRLRMSWRIIWSSSIKAVHLSTDQRRDRMLFKQP
jgi:putative membrane protein